MTNGPQFMFLVVIGGAKKVGPPIEEVGPSISCIDELEGWVAMVNQHPLWYLNLL
jgi:hypothetical protein